MKVLVITYNTKKNSGWGRMSSEILNQFDLLQLPYSVCVEQPSGRENEAVHLLPSNSIVNIIKSCFRVRKSAHNHDTVHAFDVWPYSLYGYFACIGTNRLLFINGIGTYSVAPLYRSIRRQFLRAALHRARAIFCISRYTLNEINKVVPLGKKGVVVHLGASELPIPTEATVQKARVEYASGAGPIILTVGSVDKEGRKGQLNTLQAVEILKKKYPTIKYLVVGSAGHSYYATKVKEYARSHNLEDNLQLLENINSDEELAALYSLCDVFALNSNTEEEAHHFEGFGLVFLEAYQFGKPAVGSRGCGIEDAIKDGVTGYLTEQANAEDIASKIDHILTHKEQFSPAQIKQFRSGFDWSKTAKTYISYYTQGHI